jgi:2-oxoglutarate dehydrogenase E1 component
LIHGDAAFAGQGVVYESMQMQDLKNYSVGGTIHVIVNNQIGFTTVPSKGRSGVYCSDLAKSINAPIFHVNADSLEDVHYVFKIAAEYRQKYNQDVVIDLIGYRKYGHNELDQPSFTQPMMYKRIAEMTPVARIYEKQLLENGTVDQATIDRMKKKINKDLEESYIKSKDYKFKAENWVTDQWEAIKGYEVEESIVTGLPLETLREIGQKITVLPQELTFHRLVRKIFETRTASIETGKAIDWGTAEALAFASLVREDYHVRLSGQDVERGTFSHRHAHVFYQDKDGYYNPINQVCSDEDKKIGIRKFIASNSHLSEFAVMGYELGYAQTHPNTLTLWEAQFGDFANGAQVIIDQFLVSGEAKWNVKNGLVLLLPHGYDGQGPEHSSCRTERYLLLCDQDEFVPENGEYDHYEIMKGTNM